MDNFGVFSLVEEETLVLPDDSVIIETETKKIDEFKNNLDYIVLAVNNTAFKITKPSYELDIFGRSMLDWVKSVCTQEPKVKPVSTKHNVLEEIRPLLRDAEYTIVLYSDCPLITKATIQEAVEFTISKGLNVCKLTHGYVFKTEYIKRAIDIFTSETHYFNEEDFLIATNFKQLSLINDIIKERILSYHMLNGVHIIDPSSTIIGSGVTFGSDVVVYPNNILYGKLEIGNGVTIYSDNLIGDCVIKDNSSILMSRVKKSVVGEGVSIIYSSVDKSFLGNKCDIRMDSKITSCELDDETSVVGASMFGAKTGKRCIINTNATIISYKDDKVVLKDGVIVGAGAVIPIPVVIGKNVTILPTTSVRIDVPDNSVYGDKIEQSIKPKN